MKKAIYILSGLAMLLTACSTHRNTNIEESLLVGTWEQPNVTFDLKANGHYNGSSRNAGASVKLSQREC